MTSTRRSVIFRSDGFEFVLTFCRASRLGRALARVWPSSATRYRTPRRCFSETNVVLLLCVPACPACPHFYCAWGPTPRALLRRLRRSSAPRSGRRRCPYSAFTTLQRRLHHRACVADVERERRVAAAAGILRPEVRALAVVVDAARMFGIDQAACISAGRAPSSPRTCRSRLRR